MNARNKFSVILRSPLASASERLEGWKQTPSLLPSFETVARKRATSSEPVNLFHFTPLGG
jgi:hypothetical protein